MKFYGIQKMTLLDYPGKVACTLFTGGCNLRCPFCHNALLVTEPDESTVFEEEEIIAFLKTRTGLLDGVCITGGEPLINVDIADFIKKIRELGFAVKLDTNGTFPDRLMSLVEAGLVDYVAMDIKNSEKRYAETVGVTGFSTDGIKKSIAFLLEGRVDFEFRTTVTKEFHTVQDIEEIGRMIKGAPKYFLQNFEDSGNLIGEGLHPVPKEIMVEMREKAAKYVGNAELRGI